MTDGMKSGAGSDPFADDDEGASQNEEKNGQEASTTAEGKTERKTEDESMSRSDREDLPYIFRRNGGKDDRKMIQYFLRDDTEDLEAEVKRAVEQDLDTDVYLTDLREALVRVGAEHIDEVADELREWGYRYRE